jgi:hypothetical protein
MNIFIPTVLYRSKLINLDQIETVEEEGQSRVSGLDYDNLNTIENSITHKGLQKEISVEAINIDDQNEDNSTYRLRDGNHRFLAYQNLRKKHKNSALYNTILCTVYEKNLDHKAESDWLHWQHQENVHLEMAHKSNTFNDSAYTAYKLLTDGYLDNKAATLVAKDDWDNPLVDHMLTDWIKNNCKRLSAAEREEMLTKIHADGNHLRKSKIKRYSKDELKRVLISEYGVSPKRGGAKSPAAKDTIWISTSEDFHAIALRPVYRVFKEGSKTSNNIIVHHCRKGDIDTIDKKRKSAKDMANTINNWFSSNLPAFKHVKVIDDVKFLGQKLAKEYGEKDGEFI